MLIALCGIPGSGKTTLSNKLAEQYDAKLYCFDDIPNALNPYKHKQVRHQMWLDIAQDLRNGLTVVCDDLHTLLKWRSGLLSEISDVECKKTLVVVETPLKECLRRNRNRPRQLPDFIITDMHGRFEPPSLDEGWSEIIKVKGE